MKKGKLIRHLLNNGCLPTGRQKGSHAQWKNAATGARTSVPVHSDINEFTALGICKQLGIPPVKFN